jgi:hypothetical protein
MENEKRDDTCGFLKKKKGSSICRIFGNTNLRWFEVQYENKLFGYKNTKTDKKLKRAVPFSEIVDYINSIPSADQKSCDWRYGFQVVTRKKSFILFTQSESELKKWTFAFHIILKKVPEAFPRIKESVFLKALKLFEQPYLEEVKKLKLEEEKIKKKREEEKLRRMRQEEEERIRKQIEAEELHRREIEEEENRKKLEQEEIKRMQRIEENNRKIEQESKREKLYDAQLENFISEIDERVINYEYEDKHDEIFYNSRVYENENVENNRSMNRSMNCSTLNFKEDLDDWNFYNDFDEKILDNELINYNPIANDTVVPKIKEKEQEVLRNDPYKNLFKMGGEAIQMNAPLTIKISSTKVESQIQDNKNITSQIKENQPQNDLLSRLEESISNSNKIELNETTAKYSTDILSTSEKPHLMPDNSSSANKNNADSGSGSKYKKPKFFKKRNENGESILESTLTSISVADDKPHINHVDPNIGKALISNMTLDAYEKNISNIGKLKTKPESNLNLIVESNKKQNMTTFPELPPLTQPKNISHFNYVTNPNKNLKEEILEIDDNNDNWFGEKETKKKPKLNNSTNDYNYNRPNLLETENFNDSFNEACGQKNYSFNHNDKSDNSSNELNYSFGSVMSMNKDMNNSFSNNLDRGQGRDYKIDYKFDLDLSLDKDRIEEPVPEKVELNKNEVSLNQSQNINISRRESKKPVIFDNFLDEEDEFDEVLKKQSVSKVPNIKSSTIYEEEKNVNSKPQEKLNTSLTAQALKNTVNVNSSTLKKDYSNTKKVEEKKNVSFENSYTNKNELKPLNTYSADVSIPYTQNQNTLKNPSNKNLPQVPVTHPEYFSIKNITNLEPGDYFTLDNKVDVPINNKISNSHIHAPAPQKQSINREALLKETSKPPTASIKNENEINGSFIEDFEDW